MNLLLTSNGFVTPEIVAKCEEFVGKAKSDINIAVINEAYAVEHEDHGWVIDDLQRVKDNFGGRIELVNLLANDADVVRARIAECDAIFVIGGNTDYLKSVYDKTGFSKMLPEFLKTKVYVGVSAGSMVTGKRISEEAYSVMYGAVGTYDVTEYLELVDFSVMPHLNSDDFPGRREKLLAAVEHHTGLVYGLTDNSAIAVSDKGLEFLGDAPLVIQNGKIVD